MRRARLVCSFLRERKGFIWPLFRKFRDVSPRWFSPSTLYHSILSLSFYHFSIIPLLLLLYFSPPLPITLIFFSLSFPVLSSFLLFSLWYCAGNMQNDEKYLGPGSGGSQSPLPLGSPQPLVYSARKSG